jgi:hypothetical protein
LTGILLVPAVASAQPADAPAITLGLSPATVDYGHQSVTASGTVTASAGPVAGASVTVSYLDIAGQSAQISLTTGSEGGYSGTIPDPERAAQTVTASVAATSSTASAPLGFTTDAVTITASWAQPSVNAGSTDTLSGVASYVSGGTPHPLANSPLSITFTEYSPPVYTPVVTIVETAADGSFSYATPDIADAVYMAGVTVSSAQTPYLDAGQASVYFTVNQVAEITFFSGHLTPDRVLQFFACGGIPEPLADSFLDGPLEYQWAASGHGPWKTLGTGMPENTGQCGIGGGAYTGKFTAPLANAYYRAYAPAVPGQMAAASQVIHLQRYPTRITGLTITPLRVRRDGKVTVSGRLWRLKGKWSPDTRRQIVIEYRYKNKTYTLKHRLTTDSAGRFRGTFAVPRTAAWLAAYNGSRTDFAAASKTVTIRVR